MPYPDHQDTGLAVLNVMAGLGVSPQTVADAHTGTTNDVRSPSAQKEAENSQTDKPEGPGMTEAEREKAARIIQVCASSYWIPLSMKCGVKPVLRSYQRNYRGYKTRRELKGFGLDASTRWLEVRATSFPLFCQIWGFAE